MSLKTLIFGTPEFSALTNDVPALVAALNAATVQKEDHTPIGPAGLALRLPPETVEAAAAAFEAAATGSATMRLLIGTFTSYGFDFADEVTRARLDALVAGGAMSSAVATALKSIGIYYISPAEDAGLGTITAEQVTAAIAAKAKEALCIQQAAHWNALCAKIQAGEITTNEEAVAFYGSE